MAIVSPFDFHEQVLKLLCKAETSLPVSLSLSIFLHGNIQIHCCTSALMWDVRERFLWGCEFVHIQLINLELNGASQFCQETSILQVRRGDLQAAY